MPESRSSSAGARPALRALKLLGLWQRAVRGHVPLMGAGCACSLGASGVAVSDFEIPILDYLHGRHGGTLGSVFSQSGYEPGVRGDVSALLAVVARAEPGMPDCAAMLDDLERSVQSFLNAHAAPAS